MIWTCCTTPREKPTVTFKFKNGTRVKARDSAHAIQILKSISLRDVAKVFQVDASVWIIDFGKEATIKVQGRELAQVKKLGEWSVYLDRRDLELVP